MQEIVLRLDVTWEVAEWIYHACQFSKPLDRLIAINDLARAVLAGYPISSPRAQRAALISLQAMPMWWRIR